VLQNQLKALPFCRKGCQVTELTMDNVGDWVVQILVKGLPYSTTLQELKAFVSPTAQHGNIGNGTDTCGVVQILVKGLPYSTTSEELKALVGPTAQEADIAMERRGRNGKQRSRGFGTVRFGSREHAQEAIQVCLRERRGRVRVCLSVCFSACMGVYVCLCGCACMRMSVCMYVCVWCV
jgi:hypothetical protein